MLLRSNWTAIKIFQMLFFHFGIWWRFLKWPTKHQNLDCFLKKYYLQSPMYFIVKALPPKPRRVAPRSSLTALSRAVWRRSWERPGWAWKKSGCRSGRARRCSFVCCRALQSQGESLQRQEASEVDAGRLRGLRDRTTVARSDIEVSAGVKINR